MNEEHENETETEIEMENETETEQEKKKDKGLSLLEIFIYIVLFIFCIYVMPNYVLQRTVVRGHSMKDTLHDGESLLVDKVSYRFTNPSRYDVIVFYPKGRDVDEYYVKRIYGLPGETIQIKGDDIYINDEKIDDPYAKNGTEDPGVAAEPFKLGDDEYFVLGDNREVSLDSREPLDSGEPDAPGPVKFENISGRVFLRIWPLGSFGFIK